MDTVCERLDKLSLDYLEQFGHLLSCKQLLDDTIKKGYFALSRARIIMGVNNLSRLQYSERQPMIAATTVSIMPSTDFDKHVNKDHADDALKWFGLLSPQTLRESQKHFQQTIDLSLEACRRQAAIAQLREEIEGLLKEKQRLSTKENQSDED
jgi:vacuolar-type H+-ATPase subunit D/Vma8